MKKASSIFAGFLLIFALYAIIFAASGKYKYRVVQKIQSGFIFVNEVNGNDSEIIAYPRKEFIVIHIHPHY